MSRTESSRLAFVDGLRFIAAALVVVQHMADRLAPPIGRMLAGWAPGVLGVVLFFLISGFVIPFSVRDNFEPRAFVLRRIFRIYPLYLAALAMILAGGLTGLLPEWSDVPHASAGRWIANLLLLQDFLGARPILGVSWTLIIEFAWYGLFAASLAVFRARAAMALAIVMPLGIAALAAASLYFHVRIPLARPGMIYAAVLGYQAFRYRTGQASLRELLVHAVVFLGLTGLANAISFGLFSHPRITLLQAAIPWAAAPILFLLVVTAARLREASFLSGGILPRLGKASYSLYLLHPLAIAFAFDRLPPVGAVPAALLLSLVLSLGCYRWIELPGNALGRHLTRRRAAPEAALA